MLRVSSFVLLCMILGLNPVLGGSPCPKREIVEPCSCHEIPEKSAGSKVFTLVACHHLEGISELNYLVQNLQQLTIDRFVVLNSTAVEYSRSAYQPPATTPSPSHRRYPYGKPSYPTTSAPSTTSGLWKIESVQIREIVFNDFYTTRCPWQMDTWSGFYEHLTSIIVKNGSIRRTGYCMTDLAKFTNLHHLDFSENGIGGSVQPIPKFPSTMSKLRTLDLSHNEIVSLTSGTFSNINLSVLNLSHNKMTSIQRNIFPTEDRTLKELNLSWNFIETLPGDFLLNMAAMRKLHLSHNRIQVLRSSIVEINRSLSFIDLTGNFLNCNCTMSWAAPNLERTDVKIRPLMLEVEGVCQNPRQLESKEVSDSTNYDNCPKKHLDEKK